MKIDNTVAKKAEQNGPLAYRLSRYVFLALSEKYHLNRPIAAGYFLTLFRLEKYLTVLKNVGRPKLKRTGKTTASDTKCRSTY